MLNAEAIENDTNKLRDDIAGLSDAERAEYYRGIKPLLRDPDTYATLNYLLISGLHRFYLGQYFAGSIELLCTIAGIALLFVEPLLGIALVVLVSLIELWALFRSQAIVQDFNNRAGRRLYEQIAGRQT